MTPEQISLLGKFSDCHLSRQFKISRHCIKKLRVQNKIESYQVYARSKKIEEIKRYIENTKGEPIYIKTLLDDLGIERFDNKSINIPFLREFAKEHNLKLVFVQDRHLTDHGWYKYNAKKCSCNICRLSATLRKHVKRYKFELKNTIKFVNQMTNKYVEEYHKDRKNFYRIIKDEYLKRNQ